MAIGVRSLKVNVVREEYLAVTKDTLLALVVNWLVYQFEIATNVDEYLAEESEFRTEAAEKLEDNAWLLEANVLRQAMTHGWLRKSAATIIRESLIMVSETAMRRYMEQLVKMGVVDTKFNSKTPFDRTPYWRVNLYRLNELVKAEGYTGVQGFHFPVATGEKCIPQIGGCTSANLGDVQLTELKIIKRRQVAGGAIAPVTIQKEVLGDALPTQTRRKAKRKEPDPTMGNKAVTLYRDVALCTPNLEQRKAIVAKFPDGVDENILTEWQAKVREWIVAGWNKTNVGGIIAFYDKDRRKYEEHVVTHPNFLPKLDADGNILPEKTPCTHEEAVVIITRIQAELSAKAQTRRIADEQEAAAEKIRLAEYHAKTDTNDIPF